MCGIAGLWNTREDPGAIHARLEAMRGALAHRGPDASGIHSFPGGGLAHTRLAVIDCSAAANQPFAWEDGRYHLVYNGELYNFRELRQELAQRGIVFRTTGDTEVLAAALATWGTDALERLNGIFAFAWHDARDNSLLLARDRLGVKPLYYTHQHGALAFASELGALSRAGCCNAPIDPAALEAYLTLQYIPAPRTIYQGVHKLRPGHWLRAAPQRLEQHAWWQLRYAPDPAWTLDSAAARYRHLLEDSVRMQGVADVPLGAFLSGGLDSSTVTAALARQSQAPVHTFTIGFHDAAADERPYARMAAEAFGTLHHEAVAQPDMHALLPALVRHFGEPFADSSALPTWLVSRLAREHVTVALSGDGGDELFAGYTWLHRTLLSLRAARVPAVLRGAAVAVLRGLPHPRAKQAMRFLTDAGLSPRAAFTRRLTMFSPPQRAALLGAPPSWDPVQETWDAIGAAGDAERMLGTDTTLYLPDDILTKVDRMSMAHALEVRVPLLDHRIVEFAATVPFPLKYAGGISKRLAKHACASTLPAPLLQQRKRGFALPIDRWFRAELGAALHERMEAAQPLLGEVVDIAVARRLLAEHQRGHENHGHRLWALLVLDTWLEQHSAERATPQTPAR
jgi:asparagine synthase (glutamine-hydrolysing)